MANAYDPDDVDWGFPVDWGHPLNRGLRLWLLAVPGRMGYGTTLARDLCLRNNGTCANMAFPGTTTSGWGSTTRTGGFGELRFDGTDDYGDLNPSPFVAPATVSLWVRVLSAPGGNRRILVAPADDGVTDAPWLIMGFNTALEAGCGGSPFDGNVSAGAVPAGWVMLTAVRPALKTITVYRDGNLVGSATSTGTVATPTKAYLGRYNANYGQYGNVALDDVRIYSRALSAAEVASLFLESKAGHPETLNRLRRITYSLPPGGLLLKRRRVCA